MEPYKSFRPTSFDSSGLGLYDRQDWLVAPVSRTRDSGPLEQSNWEVVLKDLEQYDTAEDLEVHRFGHWGPGWFEIILIHPESRCARIAEQWEGALSDYPVACESDYSEKETEEAECIWRDCYNNNERIKYMRKNPDQFQGYTLTELMNCARGNYFLGWPSELRQWSLYG